jgi:hypothetical protein
MIPIPFKYTDKTDVLGPFAKFLLAKYGKASHLCRLAVCAPAAGTGCLCTSVWWWGTDTASHE